MGDSEDIARAHPLYQRAKSFNHRAGSGLEIYPARRHPSGRVLFSLSLLILVALATYGIWRNS